ncbi:hypothetical protein BHM03_00055476 [Ensete ventricosum]|nr:hypothetical protein BHM03_00055476 [Ensete ventricosum]
MYHHLVGSVCTAHIERYRAKRRSLHNSNTTIELLTRALPLGPKAEESRSEGGSFFFHKSFFKQLRFLTTRSAREVVTRNGGVKVRGSQLLPRGLFQAVAVLDDKVGEGGQDQK